MIMVLTTTTTTTTTEMLAAIAAVLVAAGAAINPPESKGPGTIGNNDSSDFDYVILAEQLSAEELLAQEGRHKRGETYLNIPSKNINFCNYNI